VDYGVQLHLQQYFSYIVTVSFIGGGNEIPGENHWPTTSCLPTWSHNVVSLDYEVFYCYVYSNKIHELSEDPLSLGELKVLEMSCNYIKSVPETFFQGCNKLDTLDLENNGLGNIKYTCIARVK
jgi:hypothetical protein